eukprot:gene119-15_t
MLGGSVRAVRKDTSNVVFMGMGEPLENINAVLAAIRVLVDPQLFQVRAS